MSYLNYLSKLEELRKRCEDTVERKEKKPRPITDKEVLAVVDEVNNALKYERERVDRLRDKIERMGARGFFARLFNW